jgi:ribosome-associated protein
LKKIANKASVKKYKWYRRLVLPFQTDQNFKRVLQYSSLNRKMKKITVLDLPIRLGQFLKLANLVQDGFEAKIQIQEGEVMLNGEIETRRGKKLSNGDIITYGDTPYLVSSTD